MPTRDDYLHTPLQFLKGVGPRRAADLQRVGVSTIEDLLYRFPIRYEDRGRLTPIADVRAGQTVTIAGEITGCGIRLTRRPGFKIFEALLRDASGFMRAVWFNQPFLRDVLHEHQSVVLYGPVEARPGGGIQLTNPQYELVEEERREAGSERREGEGEEERETIHTGRIVPVYEKTGTLTPKMQRRLVYDALARLPDRVDDPVPPDVLKALSLPDRRTALMQAHFPEQDDTIDRLNQFRTPAQIRLIFEEFFLFQTGLLVRRRTSEEERKPFGIHVDARVRESARSVLPFKLTEGQKQALKEIVTDMQRPQPMNRLLQGDVGAGKTIVALLAAVVAMENGLQVAFMAPTEILSEQHYVTIRRLLEGSRFRVGLLTGATPAAARRAMRAELEAGSIDLAVGTHALVQEKVTFRALGLVVIDEQHRFGVLQRATLRAKGLSPDVLVMTATPIPRTLALTTYGDLDVSLIKGLPPGRRPINTAVKPESRREELYEFIRKQLEDGRQIYVVYPLIEESEKIDLRAATAMADHLAHDVFPEYRVALLHGRLKQKEKDGVMRRFAAGEMHILVSTTVIEVGIDVPNASVMLVEHAERFGLSQLHQLRGRVGRGSQQSYCLLLYQAPLAPQGRERLKTMAETSDGFVIAERDLALRGPGDFFGTRQSGLPTLRVGDLIRDHSLMEEARRQAGAWLDGVHGGDPLLDYVRETWAQRFGLGGVG